ncbi:MAG: subtilase family N-terminal domain-containing protein, partial [Tenuifilaceae bacterium]|nr:subtilase family N-terminal domain-containing protein [Tenuifilaceae bacterium]
MNCQFSRANLLYFVLILLGISFFQNNGIAQSNNSRFESNVKYVNGYKVVKGERPPIDLATVPADAFEQGKIYVKFTSAAKHLISDNEIVANQKGYIATGLKGFDDYCNKHRVVSAKQSISNLYKINSKAISQESRHEAWGLNLWYELSLGDDVDIKKAVSDFQQLAEVEIAEP